MPFTLAHPAIILPLKYLPKKWISLTGLIAGSLMPDFEKFTPVEQFRNVTHSWPGFFAIGIPLGLLLSFFFHNIIRNSLIAQLPFFLQKRFSKYRSFNWKKRFLNHWPVILFSMLIGGASHFFWDSFSDFDGWFVRLFPFLKGEININDKELEIAFLIQYINTLLGGMIIIAFIAAMPADGFVTSPKHFFVFWTLTFIVTAILLTLMLFLPGDKSLDGIVAAALSGFILALSIMVCVFREKKAV